MSGNKENQCQRLPLFLDYVRPIEQLEAIEISQVKPVCSQSKKNVFERLLENKLRRIELEFAREEKKEDILEKRKSKNRELEVILKQRMEYANKVKEQSIKDGKNKRIRLTETTEEKYQDILNKFELNQRKIEKYRLKAEEKRNELVAKQHQKNQIHMLNARHKKCFLQTMADFKNDQILNEEWNQYKEKLIKKYEGEAKSPPDRLYQEFKVKNQLLKNMRVQNINSKPQQVEQQEAKVTSRITRNNAVKSAITFSRKVEKFGIHETNMIRATRKDLQKMECFLAENKTVSNELEDEGLKRKLEQFLLQQILKW